MKQTADFYLFEKAFHDCNRQHHFPKGLRKLFEHLTECEEEMRQEYELDVVGLCCEFTESRLSEALLSYNLNDLNELINNTTVIIIDFDKNPTIIYSAF